MDLTFIISYQNKEKMIDWDNDINIQNSDFDDDINERILQMYYNYLKVNKYIKDKTEVIFLYNGIILDFNKTPDFYGIKNEDTILVMVCSIPENKTKELSNYLSQLMLNFGENLGFPSGSSGSVSSLFPSFVPVSTPAVVPSVTTSTPATSFNFHPSNFNPSHLQFTPISSTTTSPYMVYRQQYRTQIDILKEMGFQEEIAIQALVICNGNIDDAANWILN